ncbi:MAG: tRNA 2-thiouridine(34) synthase MnmA [Patescibacteria group bacterium]|nr:tRNA 2-thiouridine(34) synthase MnmA [Patescibacteria group bacterium]
MNQRLKRNVFIMMSGGVDSSVAAFLLSKKKKYNLAGCFIKGYNIDGCREKEVEDARRVAQYLNISFYIIDLEKEYEQKVVNYMIEGYKKGITPNPDVMCNKEIKFGLFLEKALKLGADYVATGHYARIKTDNQTRFLRGRQQTANNKKKEIYNLFQAKDLNKDQSYFLWTLTQNQLKYLIFPIGDYLKSEVRQIAKKAGLPTAEKKESQGICFLGKFNLKEFLKQKIKPKKGDILLTDGKKIGEHDGVWFYTIGQRHINAHFFRSTANYQRKPLYISRKDIKKNILYVVENNDGVTLHKKEIELADVNIINRQSITDNSRQVLARTRYRQPLIPATLIYDSKLKTYKLIFESSQKFIAPGQSAVFYTPVKALLKKDNKKGELLGGGIIK